MKSLVVSLSLSLCCCWMIQKELRVIFDSHIWRHRLGTHGFSFFLILFSSPSSFQYIILLSLVVRDNMDKIAFYSLCFLVGFPLSTERGKRMKRRLTVREKLNSSQSEFPLLLSTSRKERRENPSVCLQNRDFVCIVSFTGKWFLLSSPLDGQTTTCVHFYLSLLACPSFSLLSSPLTGKAYTHSPTLTKHTVDLTKWSLSLNVQRQRGGRVRYSCPCHLVVWSKATWLTSDKSRGRQGGENRRHVLIFSRKENNGQRKLAEITICVFQVQNNLSCRKVQPGMKNEHLMTPMWWRERGKQRHHHFQDVEMISLLMTRRRDHHCPSQQRERIRTKIRSGTPSPWLFPQNGREEKFSRNLITSHHIF